MQKASSVKKKIGDYSFYLTDLIGSGYSSKVYKCFKRSSPKQLLAIKVISLEGMGHANFELLKNEIQILQTMKHNNILQFHQVYYTQNNCYVITDLCDGGNLQQYIDSTPKSTEFMEYLPQLYLIFEQILQGCQYLAQMNILHRDLKPANIFNKNGVWKIGDFGFARFVQYNGMVVRQRFRIGSPLYMPLETLRDNIYSNKTDSFAFGILLFNLFTKQFPWGGSNRKELQLNLEAIVFPKSMLDHVDPFVAQFICGLVQIQMENRYSVCDFILNPCLVGEQIEATSNHYIEIPLLNLWLQNAEESQQKIQKLETDTNICVQREESVETCSPSSINCDSEQNIDLILQSEYQNYQNLRQNSQYSFQINKIQEDRLMWNEDQNPYKKQQNSNRESYERNRENSWNQVKSNNCEENNIKGNYVYYEDQRNEQNNGNDGRDAFAEMTKTISLLDIIQRIKLAKFIFYLGTNMNQNVNFVDEVSQNLSLKLKSLLKSCLLAFGWLKQNKCLYLQEFEAEGLCQIVSIEEIFNIYILINKTVARLTARNLTNQQNIRYSNVLKVKLNQIKHLLKLSTKGDFYFVKDFVGQLVLHPNFEKVLMTEQQVEQSERL